MKRLVSSLLALSLCVSPAVVRKSKALDIFTVFNQEPKNQTNIQHLKEECEREKALRLPLSEQKNCIMFGQENADEEVKKDIERFKNSDRLKKLSQAMFNLSKRAIYDARIKYYKELMSKGTPTSDDELKALLDSVKNSEEAKNLTNCCKSVVEKIREKYRGAIEVPTNLTANGEKIRASEIIQRKLLTGFLCEELPLNIMENAVN